MRILFSVVLNVFLAVFLGVATQAALAQEAPTSDAFATVKMKTFDGEKFVFPEGMKGTELNVVFLGMSDSQENGEWQQQRLLDIQAALDEKAVFSEKVMAYHFPAMSSPPFFVKGVIARAMAESYEGKVPLDQAGVMYLDDLQVFAIESGLMVDDQPTIVIADASGKPMQVFKGELSDELIDKLLVAIRGDEPAAVKSTVTETGPATGPDQAVEGETGNYEK